jgi:hypothetical protein
LLNDDGSDRSPGLGNILCKSVAIKTLTSQRQQQGASHIGMRANRVHHTVGIRIRIATPKADQVNRLTFKNINNLSGHVVCTLHQVGNDNAVANALAAVGPKIPL